MAELRISNSMVNNYNECQKKYELAHIDKLMKVGGAGPAITRGLTGHKILEVWAKGIIAGKPSGDALVEGMQAGMAFNMEHATNVFPMVAHWVNNTYPTLGWKILEVEKTYYVRVGQMPNGDDLIFPYTVDLLVEADGKLVIVDHKFQADPFDDDWLFLHPQLKRYIIGMRAQKINVHHGIFNTFRTRANLKAGPEERNVPQKDVPTVPQLKVAMFTQIEGMKAIATHEGEYLRALNKNVCTYCQFKKICLVETSGEDSTLVRRYDYTETDYGYDDE